MLLALGLVWATLTGSPVHVCDMRQVGGGIFVDRTPRLPDGSRSLFVVFRAGRIVDVQISTELDLSYEGCPIGARHIRALDRPSRLRIPFSRRRRSPTDREGRIRR
jgi:hypothetical protein